MAEQARNCATETVDRLVWIAHDHQPRLRLGRREQTQQLELSRIDVLELVDQDEPELRPQPVAQRWVGLQQLDRTRDEVAKIEEPRVCNPPLVGLIQPCQHPQPLAGAGFRGQQQRRRMHEVLLHQRDERERVMRECVGAAHPVKGPEHLCVQLLTGEHRPHDDPFLESVQEKALSIGCVLAQEARAEAVESRDPRLAVVVAQSLVDPARNLAGRSGRKGQDEDLVASGQLAADGLLVQVDQRVGLSRARPGQHT